MFNANDFAKRLQQARNDLGLTRASVAEKIDIPVSSLGNYERGDKIPNAETLSKIASFYGVPADYLIGLTDQKTIKEWPAAIPIGSAPAIAKIKSSIEQMISNAFLAPYCAAALDYYAEILQILQTVDEIVAEAVHTMALKYPGFCGFGRLDAIEIDGMAFRTALVQGNPLANEYVADYDNAVGDLQSKIGEIASRITSLINGQLASAVTCGAVVTISGRRGFPDPEDLDVLGTPGDHLEE